MWSIGAPGNVNGNNRRTLWVLCAFFPSSLLCCLISFAYFVLVTKRDVLTNARSWQSKLKQKIYLESCEGGDVASIVIWPRLWETKRAYFKIMCLTKDVLGSSISCFLEANNVPFFHKYFFQKVYLRKNTLVALLWSLAKP